MKMRTTFRGLPLSLLLGGSDAAEAKFLGGFREVQVLDSYQKDTYTKVQSGDIALQDHNNFVRYRTSGSARSTRMERGMQQCRGSSLNILK
jgi:hypothetical protein